MNEPIDSRVTHLEFRTSRAEEDIQALKKSDETTGKALKSIQDTLNQIKYIAVGAVGAFVASQVGLLEILKKFVHL